MTVRRKRDKQDQNLITTRTDRQNSNLKGHVLSSSRWLQSSTSSSYDCYYGIGISTQSVKRIPVDNGEEFTIATSESLSLSSRSVIHARTHTIYDIVIRFRTVHPNKK